MKTFIEYMDEESDWTWEYTWTPQDSEDLDTTNPTDDDVEKNLSEIVKNLQNHPDYRLPDYINVDFTALGDMELVPRSFHVESESDAPEEFWGRDYVLDFKPQLVNKDNVFIAGTSTIKASYRLKP